MKAFVVLMLILKCWTLLAFIAAAESAKILIVIPFSAKSHYHGTRDLGLELARRGHEIHVITTHAEQNAPRNYHQIMVEQKDVWSLLGHERMNVFTMRTLGFASFQNFMYETGNKHTELVLNSPEVKKFMAEDHRFDLVINEVFLQEALYMFAHVYNAPLVLITTFGNSFKTNYFTRNPPQLSTLVHEYGTVAEPGSFWGRLKNLYFCLYDMAMIELYYMPSQERLVKKYFNNLPQPVPSLKQLTANASLVLMNTHFSADGAATYLPNTIEVGGLHLKNSDKSLPEDLQRFMDSSPDGVVLVSFGSNVQSSELPQHKRDAFLNVFRRLKQKVLWKWEEPDLPGKPDNVEIRKWLPQKEILAHPNTKVFIGHGGLLGVQEATYYGVPLLGVPVFGDQFNNLLQAKKEGYAEILQYEDISEENIEKYLIEMLTNEEYNRKAKEIAQRYVDRPMSGLDTAMFWIEYVIRHNGAPFMKSQGLNMNVLAFYMVDIEICFLLILIAVIFVFYKLVKIFTRKSDKKSSDIKKKAN